MELGAFSISLNVKNIQASHEFYEKLGFKEVGGDINQNWLILRNGDHTIGLFQGMFEKNTMTFNPGWDKHAQPLDSFSDIRDIQKHLKDQNMELLSEVDINSKGPGSIVMIDPDGNPILIDQHV